MSDRLIRLNYKIGRCFNCNIDVECGSRPFQLKISKMFQVNATIQSCMVFNTSDIETLTRHCIFKNIAKVCIILTSLKFSCLKIFVTDCIRIIIINIMNKNVLLKTLTPLLKSHSFHWVWNFLWYNRIVFLGYNSTNRKSDHLISVPKEHLFALQEQILPRSGQQHLHFQHNHTKEKWKDEL